MKLSHKLIDFNRRELMTPEIKIGLIEDAQELENSFRNSAAMVHNGVVVRIYSLGNGVGIYVGGELRLTLI